MQLRKWARPIDRSTCGIGAAHRQRRPRASSKRFERRSSKRQCRARKQQAKVRSAAPASRSNSLNPQTHHCEISIPPRRDCNPQAPAHHSCNRYATSCSRSASGALHALRRYDSSCVVANVDVETFPALWSLWASGDCPDRWEEPVVHIQQQLSSGRVTLNQGRGALPARSLLGGKPAQAVINSSAGAGRRNIKLRHYRLRGLYQ